MGADSFLPQPVVALVEENHGRAALAVASAVLFWALDFAGYFIAKAALSKTVPEKELHRTALAGAARFAGAVHLLIQIPFGLLVVFEPGPRNDRFKGSTGDSIFLLTTSAGFFLYDSYHCSKNLKVEGPAYLFHALACCFAYSYATFANVFHFYGACFVLFECSTPFVYLRWLLFKVKASSQAQTLNGLALMLAFFIVRIIGGTFLVWLLWHDTGSILLGKAALPGVPTAVMYVYWVLLLGLTGLNYHWFRLMVVRALQVARGTSKTADLMTEKDE